MKKAGYEIEIQNMRDITKQCRNTKDKVMVLNFVNAFHSYDWNLVLLFTVAQVLGPTKLKAWL